MWRVEFREDPAVSWKRIGDVVTPGLAAEIARSHYDARDSAGDSNIALLISGEFPEGEYETSIRNLPDPAARRRLAPRVKHGWPWGANQPTQNRRLIFATALALICAVSVYLTQRSPNSATDFDQIWLATREMLSGNNPYQLIGPGLKHELEYLLPYPATAFVAAIPVAGLSREVASSVFVALSVFLLAYGSSRDSWHRVPMFASFAFFDSVFGAQWTIILAAAWFLPWLSALTIVKPQSGLPIVAGSRSRVAILSAFGGGAFLLAVSLYYLPSWPRDWTQSIRAASHIRSPLVSGMGPLFFALLLRWRRPEAWLVLATAILPQTFMWYSALVLLLVASTYREAVFLSLVSSVGAIIVIAITKGGELHELYGLAWSIYLMTTFLPAIAVIFLLPNVGEGPAWLAGLRSRSIAESGRVTAIPTNTLS